MVDQGGKLAASTCLLHLRDDGLDDRVGGGAGIARSSCDELCDLGSLVLGVLVPRCIKLGRVELGLGELGRGGLALELGFLGVAKLRKVRFFGSILLLFPHRRIGMTKKSFRSFDAL